MRETNGRSYAGPSWRDVYGALDLIEDKFGGGFLLEITSAATYGNHRTRGLHLRVVWRRWHNFNVVEWRATKVIYDASLHASVPSAAMTLIRDLWDNLAREGFEKQPFAPGREVEPPPLDCDDVQT